MLPVQSESGGGSVLIKKELKRARRAIDNNLFVDKEVFKVTLKAHFQIPNVSGHKFKPTPSIPSKKINSDEINDLEDLYVVIKRHEEIDSLPIEFHNITCNSTIDIGICNLNRGSSSAVDDGHKLSIIKKRKANDDVLLQSSSSTTVYLVVDCLFSSSSTLINIIAFHHNNRCSKLH